MFDAAIEVIHSGEIGTVEHLEALFHVKGPIPTDDIRRNYALGGGVRMEIGCYPVSWVRHLMQSEPQVMRANAVRDPEEVDVERTGPLSFSTGAAAMVTGSMQAGADFKAVI